MYEEMLRFQLNSHTTRKVNITRDNSDEIS